MTPWVGRLMAANAVVLLLLYTVFTDPRVADALSFHPAGGLARPWSFLTYMFVHGGLLHLATNMLGLWVFGAPVEARMGSRAFILYYLYCGIGAAFFAVGLAGLMAVPPFVGASGAVLGVALAFAMFWPDAELLVFPIPTPIRARTLVAVLVGLDLVGALWFRDGVAHVAHLGGVVFGYLFFRLQAYARGPAPERPRKVERPVMVPAVPREERRVTPVRAAVEPPAAVQPSTREEVDRVLDKISAHGMASLTAEERRFLDEVARRKRESDAP